MNGMHKGLKRRRGVILTAVVGLLLVGGAAMMVTAAERDRSEQQRTHDPMTEMMRGTRMGPSTELLGRERPLLSLALRHRTELGLSADQVKALETLVERFRKDAESRANQIEATEQELAGLVKADPADMTSVEAKVRAIEKQRADVRLARIRTIAEGRAALTPEQRKKLEELVASPHGGRTAPRTRGMEEMERFMSSDRMPQAMTAMMDMARRMGDGDVMLGMVRMMEMMGSMGGMMGGEGGGMMGSQPHRETPEERK